MKKAQTIWLFILFSNFVYASVPTAERFEATSKKSGKYQSEGFFAGGFKDVTSVTIKDIRRAQSQEGFERIVFDIESSMAKGIPYFQIQPAPDEGRVIVSIWSDVQYDFSQSKIVKAFSKSSHIKKVNVIPRVEDGLAVIELIMHPKSKMKMEAFYLTAPNRIILDLL